MKPYPLILLLTCELFFCCNFVNKNKDPIQQKLKTKNKETPFTANNNIEDSTEFSETYYGKDADWAALISGPEFPIEDESRFIDADLYNINISPKGDYNKVKFKIKSQKQQFKNKYLNCSNNEEKQKLIDQARKYITDALLNKIIPFWYGMPWDMAGYSDIPNEGEVGCSYFVSNTMKHCGFKVNRYRLAQQNTKNIALSIQLNNNILILKGMDDIATVKNYFLENKKEGLYYVGLDSHVGYLLFRKNELFFIQSNYSLPLIVLTEMTERSDVFLSSQYYIADITWNDELIQKWILGNEIIVVKS